jgi:hypothetical protein
MIDITLVGHFGFENEMIQSLIDMKCPNKKMLERM